MSRTFETTCHIEIEHTAEHLHAHVRLDGDTAIEPGDRVRVHGAPIRVEFGARQEFERRATVTRATPLRRAWTKLRARFELTELYELNFTGGRIA